MSKTASELFNNLFDNGEYSVIDTYADKAAAFTAFGAINGVNAYSFCQNNGAFSVLQCKKIIALYELAVKTGCPVIGFYSSDGVELSEGFEVLGEYSELLNKAFSVSGVIPQVSVIVGNTLGINALMCNTADVVIACKDVDFYLTPDSENKTDTSFKEGVVDILCDSEENAVNTAKQVISYFPSNNLTPAPVFDFSEPQQSDSLPLNIADAGSLTEIKSEWAGNVNTYLASVSGLSCGIVSFNGNPLCPKCSYKAESFIKLCNAYNLPVITIADSEGLSNKNDNQLITALTKLASAYSNATCPKISVISKNAIGGALVLLAGKGANADITIALENSVISALPVSSAVAFMYDERLANGEDRDALEKEYILTQASPENALNHGALDKTVTVSDLRAELINSLNMLISKRETTIPRKHTVK